MLYSKTRKYTKYHKPSVKKKCNKTQNNLIISKRFGLIAAESGFIHPAQFETIRRVFSPIVSNKGKMWLNFVADFPKTKKNLGERMGSGKGGVHCWLGKIASGQVFLEISNISESNFLAAAKIAKSKLSIKTFVIKL